MESLSRPFTASKHPEAYIERTRALLDHVGSPEAGLKIIHITGTAGKGTVSRLVQSALVQDGYHTGLFTSPHVTAEIEKIQVDEKYISPIEYSKLVDEIRPHIMRMSKSILGPPTYFEALFVLALMYFRQKKCSYAVIEVGLGGRFDATNAVRSPIVTAITNIDYDHTDVLGRTLRKIASDKAGIIKKGSAFFTTVVRPALLQLFTNTCQAVGATYHGITPNVGGYREMNIALAQAILTHLGVRHSAFKIALKGFRLPARFERLSRRPHIIIDGAHNPLKIRALVEDLMSIGYKRLILIAAFSKGKDVRAMLKILLPRTSRVYFTSYSSKLRSCVLPIKVQKIARSIRPIIHTKVVQDAREVLKQAKAILRPGDLILVTGSFYLASAIRSIYFPEDQVLKRRASFR